MSIYNIQNTNLRRAVLVVAIIPLVTFFTLASMAAGVVEFIREVPPAVRKCWRAR